MNDIPEYAGVKASVEEFKQQNSYNMFDLFGGLMGNEEENMEK